ncbi:MAG: chorismate synthase [candidate division Zixibacteria bacterium CG_4_9_14_3_um_filter_46_8]|nr:MAG: chorismate synthase [candidate division Zixibacteria bacterium CG_4_9_14_3_um_filter_46_8]
MRYLSSGESHGSALTVIIEGLPAGIRINVEIVNKDLANRQAGFGRGERMKIETDQAEFTAGLWNGMTIGSPLTIMIRNRDWENWKDKRHGKNTVPRPGHADLTGLLKYNADDIQTIIERSSARETAAKVAAGSVAKIYLGQFGVKLIGHTIMMGAITAENVPSAYAKLKSAIEKSDLRCADANTASKMRGRIQKAIDTGDTVGGVVEVRIFGVPPGIGSYVQWDRRLEGLLAQALMAIPAVKAVEVGEGFENAGLSGSEVHDPIYYSKEKGYYRKTNRAGGIEGGMSNGETIICRAYLKPISTLQNPLPTVNTKNHKGVMAPYVRSDTAVIPAASVVAEAAAAWVMAVCLADKFGGDSIKETLRNYKGYLTQIKGR